MIRATPKPRTSRMSDCSALMGRRMDFSGLTATIMKSVPGMLAYAPAQRVPSVPESLPDVMV